MVQKSVEVLSADLVDPSRTAGACAGGTTRAEEGLAEVLAGIMRVDQVPVDSNFFHDLGADSMVMAHFCARVRKRLDLPSVSMKDVYRYPTITSLATALVDTAPAPSPAVAPAPVEVPATAPVSTSQYVLCGAMQLLIFVGYSYLAVLVAVQGAEWISAGAGIIDVYLRSVVFGGASFLGMCMLPILAKWLLIGRWKPQQIRIWSLAYVRFWVVKTLVRSNPLVMFAGTPMYVLYLRALGAHVGRGVAIHSRNVPVCTDLFTVGDGAVIRKDAFLLCYRAHAGWIQTGAVTLGRDVFIGEKTVLDIDTSMGDGAQLGHTSALHIGETVPDGERWHGSPAQRTELDYLRVAPAACGSWRRAGYCIVSVLQVFLLFVPLSVGGVYALATVSPVSAELLTPGTEAVTSPVFYLDALVLSLMVFFGTVLVGLVMVMVVPRVLNIFVTPDRVYPLYGFHYSVHRAITRMTNVKFYTRLFGDSSYIVHYLRCLGYDMSKVEQTGSNFGTEVQHETPFLSSIGSGTMVADGLSIMNADYSSTSFRLSRTSIGSHSFLGNNIAYPPQSRIGENCLLATKVMIPLDGEIREGVGLLGSPCFEIPRSVERDGRFDRFRTGDELRSRLARKNRYNLRSMGVFLFIRWLHFFLLTVLAVVAFDLYGTFGHVTGVASLVLSLPVSTAYFLLVERALAGFRALQPRFCSIYEPYFWWHERLWKVPDTYLQVFDGTPFKNVVWRLLGVRLGARVFDDGCYLTERTLTTIGSDCTLNVGSKIQCHSQEDGTFKSDRTVLGAGCTLEIGAFIHYGVTIGDGAVIAADSFLMKGEDVPQHAQWGGNPARELDMTDAGPLGARAGQR